MDHWSECLTLQDRFPWLFNLFMWKYSPPSDFLSSLNWNLHFKKNLRDIEMKELTSFLEVLKDCSVRPEIPDRRCWSIGSEGINSVLSFLHDLMHPLISVSFRDKQLGKSWPPKGAGIHMKSSLDERSYGR